MERKTQVALTHNHTHTHTRSNTKRVGWLDITHEHTHSAYKTLEDAHSLILTQCDQIFPLSLKYTNCSVPALSLSLSLPASVLG